MGRLVAAGKDPRYVGVTSLTTASVVAFVLFLPESVPFKVVFATSIAAAFAVINLGTLAAALPSSRAAPEAVRKSRAILLWMSLVVVFGSIIGAVSR